MQPSSGRMAYPSGPLALHRLPAGYPTSLPAALSIGSCAHYSSNTAGRGRASAATSLDTTIGILTVNYKNHGGEVVFSSHGDDEYMAEVDINLNSGTDGAIYFRYLDPDNWYRALIRANGAVKLEKMLWGKKTTLGSGTYTASTWTLVKIIYDEGASEIKVNVAATDVITSTDSAIPRGYVALSSWQAKFQDLRLGYDTNGDDVVEDMVIGDLVRWCIIYALPGLDIDALRRFDVETR